MANEVSLELLHDQYTKEASQKEAMKSPTVRSGAYRFKIQGVKVQEVTQEDVDKSQGKNKPVLGRLYANINAALFDRQTGARKGSLFFKASWQENYVERDNQQKLDGQFKLWAGLLKAFKVETKSVKEVIEEILPNYGFEGYVDEVILMPDGSFKSYRGETDEAKEKARKELIDNGGQPRMNTVQSVWALKV